MFDTIHHFQQLSSCVGDNSCGVYFNTSPGDSGGLYFGGTHLQNNSDTTLGVGKGFLADSNSTVTYAMTGSDQGMFTSGSAINNFWADTTVMDNIRGGDITDSTIAGSLETIGANTTANNVRGGHSVHTATTENVSGGTTNAIGTNASLYGNKAT
jgi:hypothetical protein